MGRNKIEIKEMEGKPAKYLFFARRRPGLFKKANDVAVRGCSIVVIVFSPSGKVYAFCHPNMDSVAARFLGGQDPVPGGGVDAAPAGDDPQERNDDVQEPEEEVKPDQEGDTAAAAAAAAAAVEAEEKPVQVPEEVVKPEEGDTSPAVAVKAEQKPSSLQDDVLKSEHFWWNRRIDGMRLQKLEEFHRSLVNLRKKVIDRANQLHMIKPGLHGMP